MKKRNSAPRRELRTFTAPAPLTLRTLQDGTKQLQGYAIVWNSRSVDLGGFTEICAPTMLDRTLKESPDVLALRDHKPEMLLGRTTAGTLKLKVDSKGLRFAVNLPKTQIGEDTAENIRLGNLSGCSFGFNTRDDDWQADADGTVLRILKDVDLYEISVTSFPAYEQTSVSTRSAPKAIRTKLTVRSVDDNCDPEFDDDCEDEDRDIPTMDNGEFVDSPSELDSVRCECSCSPCLAEKDCSRCQSSRCDDDRCFRDHCPMQDYKRSADKVRVARLFNHRKVNNTHTY